MPRWEARIIRASSRFSASGGPIFARGRTTAAEFWLNLESTGRFQSVRMSGVATSSLSPSSPRAEQRARARGREGDVLLDGVRESLATLAALIPHGEHLGASLVSAIKTTVTDVERKLARQDLAVVIIGEKGAGKTTFLNALLGEELLPSGAREPNSVMILRRGSTESYRARLVRGEVEVFEDRFPDRAMEILERLQAVERALADATDERERAVRNVEATEQGLKQAQSALKGAFRSFESARDEAERIARDLAGTEANVSRLENETAERERALPALALVRPPPWAFWLWILRAIFCLLHFDAWRAHRRVARELNTERDKASSLRQATNAAAEGCLLAEAALTPAASPSESAELTLAEARSRLTSVESRIAQLTRECAVARDELERSRVDRRRRYFEEVRALCDPGSRGKDVVELQITFPARLLPEDVTIIDTPGVTDERGDIQRRALDVIRDRADGCILVSELERAVSGPTKVFLKQLRDVVPHLLLVLTKMDESFTEALRKRGSEPWEEVERARRIGTRRFARELGRDPSTVFSLAVSAKPALRAGERSGLARRFAQDAEKLFQLLRHERAFILGSRAAGEVRRCIGSTADAEQRAERSYRDRIAALEKHRTPEPDLFCAEQLQAAEPKVRAAAAAVTASTVELMRQEIRLIRVYCASSLDSCSSRAELLEAVPDLEQAIVEGIGRVHAEVARHVEARADAAVRDIESDVFEALRQRYGISHRVTRSSNPSIHLEPMATLAQASPGLAPRVERSLKSYKNSRVGLGVGGAAAGALVGTAIFVGVGTALGAAVGALLSFVKKFATVKRDCLAAVDDCLQKAELALAEQLHASESAAARLMSTALQRSVASATRHYGESLAAPLEAERAAIEREHNMLNELVSLRERLQEHDARLASVMKAAVEASLGLCK